MVATAAARVLGFAAAFALLAPADNLADRRVYSLPDHPPTAYIVHNEKARDKGGWSVDG